MLFQDKLIKNCLIFLFSQEIVTEIAFPLKFSRNQNFFCEHFPNFCKHFSWKVKQVAKIRKKMLFQSCHQSYSIVRIEMYYTYHFSVWMNHNFLLLVEIGWYFTHELVSYVEDWFTGLKFSYFKRSDSIDIITKKCNEN
jgi:hypothetical protein